MDEARATVSNGELSEQVLSTVQAIAEVELDHHEPITLRQRLNEDLHLDSIGMVVVAVGLENRFRVKLGEEDGVQLKTVGDLVGLVCRRVLEERAS
ncbi:MAG: acyl carrier protein [Myxococcales bacterium]|nr:acyl carrier protein [Myxococcales bacterium]